MASFSDKTPPPFDRNKDDYIKWKKSFSIWQSITEAPNTKHGGLLALRLDDDTREEVLEILTTDDLKSETGAKKVTDELDKIFKRDVKITAYEAYEQFESYQRPGNTSILDYCKEFQRRLKKVQEGGTNLADHILAYRLVKSAQLSESQHQLLTATTEEMTYAKVTDQLKKIFKSDEKAVIGGGLGVRIKEEPVEHNTLYGGRRPYTNAKTDYRKGGFQSDSKWKNREGNDQKGDGNKKTYKKKGKNPPDQYGRVTRCMNCDSINHWIRDCPDMSEQEHKTYLQQYKVEYGEENDIENEDDDGLVCDIKS